MRCGLPVARAGGHVMLVAHGDNLRAQNVMHVTGQTSWQLPSS